MNQQHQPAVVGVAEAEATSLGISLSSPHPLLSLPSPSTTPPPTFLTPPKGCRKTSSLLPLQETRRHHLLYSLTSPNPSPIPEGPPWTHHVTPNPASPKPTPSLPTHPSPPPSQIQP
ncbi:uncharacterized protein [Macrobrachium rosenbergii]|uniref:uncharacterized protein n=1 Tax=Macrobrachium rosenbergii TaxID=79674 RepID=UPI0034D5E2E9